MRQAYCRVLQRPADSAGLAYWSSRVRAGQQTAQSLVYALLNSYEYRSTRVNGKTNPQIATALFDVVLARSPDTEGLAYWASRLSSLGYLAVAASMQASSEYQNNFGATRVPGDGRAGCQ